MPHLQICPHILDEPFAPNEDLEEKVCEDTTEVEEAAAAAVRENESLCKCKWNDGEPCYTRYSREDLEFYRLQNLEMSREELDISILSKLWTTATFTQLTTRSKQKHPCTRRTQKTCYMFANFRICRYYSNTYTPLVQTNLAV